MTTQVFVYIATQTTYERTVPASGITPNEFQRQTANLLSDLALGQTRAGDLLFRPIEKSISGHLLCDGTLLSIDQFRQLYDEIGTEFGGDGVTTFALPDYTDQPITAPAATVTQNIVEGGTVSSGEAVTTPTNPGETGGTTGGNVPSGGRPIRGTEDV